MTIKIQVKDNRGCTPTFADRNRPNTCGTGTFGVAADTAMPAVGFGVAPLNGAFAPISGGFGHFGMDTAGLAPFAGASFMTSPMSGLGLTGMQTGLLGALPTQLVVNRIAAIDPSLGQIATQLAAIDPVFVATLGKIAGGCTWTAATLVKIAGIDLHLAKSLANLAMTNPHQALAIASVAMINPMLARQQLAGSGWNTATPTLGAGTAPMTSMAAAGVQIPVDIYDDGSAYVIEADVPGVSLDDVDLSVANGTLVIEALASRYAGGRTGLPTIVREKVGPRVLRREFTIGSDVEATDISARIVNGLLTIELPKKVAMNGQIFSREGSLAC